MAMSVHTFKVEYGDTMLRINATRNYGRLPDITFVKLQDTIRHSFKITAPSDFALVYTDKENDEVLLTGDDDIYDACVRQDLDPVRVRVLVNGPHQPPDESLTDDPPVWAEKLVKELTTKFEAEFADIKQRLDDGF